ncbi:YggT family protein [Nitrospina watsonii]|uniref:YggT family protein n=1 Tax=Nitrospina watsonii TaxID=1323948 RepID=UPI00249062DD|nr:YggT family protein [Nitrospina watsonii]
MFILAEFLKATATVLSIALNLYMWIVIIRALLSWVNPDPHNPIVQFLHTMTDPVMNRVRKWIGMGGGMGIDFSPIIILLAIVFLQEFLVTSIRMLALQMQ